MPDNELSKLPQTFRAFSHRNYRLYFFGQGLSLVGTWVQRTALIWLVYRLSGSAQILGTIDFAGQISGLVLIPFAGAMLDRYSRYRTVVVAQALSMLQALTLAALVLSGQVLIWQLALLNIVLGVINSFDMPARQSFISEIVDEERDLPNAIALNSAMFNSARIIGPSVAGVAIGFFGEGVCFLLNGISYGAVLVSLLMMRLPVREARPVQRENILEGIWDGMRYSYQSLPIRTSLLLLIFSSLTCMPVLVLLPVFVGEVLGGGPTILGGLMTCFGVGALLGTLALASRSGIRGLERVIFGAAGVGGTALVLFTFVRSLYIALPLAVIIGFGMIAQMAATNTALQTLVDESKRGRVMSLYTLTFGGFGPIGSLLTGSLAAAVGAPRAFLLTSLIYLAGVAVFARFLSRWRLAAEKIYRAKGMLE
ncbi:MAG TPA: MFS transporter [Patescibacteria group bacterium]|nr:MFS transporter [Patescibacteria group bacterium]